VRLRLQSASSHRLLGAVTTQRSAVNFGLTPFAQQLHAARVKTRRKQQRKTNSITTGRWTAYMAAAAATSFAAAGSAEAEIHYSGLVNQKIAAKDRAIFHLGSGGGGFSVHHFDFKYGSSNIFGGGVAGFHIYGAESASVNGASNTCHKDTICVSNLNRGDAISVRPFVSGGGALAWDNQDSYGEFGQFLERGFGLVGFKFNDGAGVHYGWVRVKMSGAPENMVEVVDYAYGDPGDTVVAGKKSGDSAPSLESLGGLAVGAAGLLAWRRRRSG
jgi:hypothetical protein